jgi:hypothetical protein
MVLVITYFESILSVAVKSLCKVSGKMKTLIYSIAEKGKRPIGISDGRLWIIETPGYIVDKLVAKHHYSHKATKNRFLSFLVNDGMGFLQLGYGIKPAEKHTISSLITKDNYCEFDRMWLSDELPKFSETRVISLLLSYLKQVYRRIKFVITYADGSVGNTGIIYKASNAIPAGKVPVDFYVLPSGERVHPVTMFHRHGGRAKATMEQHYPGIKHIRDSFQYRFVYVLNRKMKKDFINQQKQDNFDLWNSAEQLSTDDFADILI